MKFGTQLEHTTRKIFGHRAIAYLSHGSCGGHFTKWWPEFTIFAHKLYCIDYGWCKTHSSGSMYHLLLTCYAYASHGLEHNYVWWLNKEPINVLRPCHACHISHICLTTYVGPTRANTLSI